MNLTQLTCRRMRKSDIQAIIPFYIDYYNTCEEGQWTPETTYKRIHQVWSREDSMCLILEDGDTPIGFAMGYFEQYDDLKAYDLIEIVIAHPFQNQGIGTFFMAEIEHQVKALGGAMVQLEAVNDAMHERFYGKLGYRNATNLVLKTKWL